MCADASLAAHVHRLGQTSGGQGLAECTAVAVLAQVYFGVAHLETHGIIHGGISPDTVFVRVGEHGGCRGVWPARVQIPSLLSSVCHPI